MLLLHQHLPCLMLVVLHVPKIECTAQNLQNRVIFRCLGVIQGRVTIV